MTTENTIAAEAYFGPTDDRFPGTLYTNPQGILRVVAERDFYGFPLWRIQKRTSNAAGGYWVTQASARSKAELQASLGASLATEPGLSAFIAGLPSAPA